LELLQEAIKKKELAPVDHSLVNYLKVRKNLYVVPRVLAHLAKKENEKELATKRDAIGVKVRGKGCPPPVDTWEQCGLPDKILKTLRKV
jgi:ATP-dependent RNA helicase DDX46/PRP5